MSAGPAIKQLVHGLLRELHSPASRHGVLGIYRAHVMDTARRFRVTGEEHCRARDELAHLGALYHSYLSSRRRHQLLLQTYKGGGERTTADTAAMVGFKLPHDPR
ncbi:Protein FMC1 [Amphibalanus amphitrite]|uniref:Protein FMC1 homolog n=1 Tax=Amphibalanus amphitrite TaxID=1232801 RepID=A0A6A4X062_AMPAM|nr:protein FMC1 homolog [Amphibalanus amphitrite]KAF0312625.1 Protein FMC1 [Amphibalanus amphitrite]